MKYPVDANVLKSIKINLSEKNLTVAVAESVTAGMIQNAVSQIDGASAVFQGGMTVYNLGQKTKQLDINPIAAEACNSVSEAIAQRLSLKIAEKFNAEIGIGITGYGEPLPEENIEAAFAYFAISLNGSIISSGKLEGAKNADLYENQLRYTEFVLKNLAEKIK